MHKENGHSTRQKLLLFLDGEMAPEEALQTQTHLLNCEVCAAVLNDMVSALAQVDALYQAEIQHTPSHANLRSVLKTRLHQETRKSEQRWQWAPIQRPLMYGALALLISALGVGWAHHHAMQQWPAVAQDRPVPNPELTPGAVRTVSLAEICPAKDDDKDPTVPTELQQIVFDEYGVAKSTRGREFQVDYLINPQLGGTGEIRNLWPQPYQSTVWNADAKDALEERLHTMVCERQIDLAAAQHEIATDWIAAYKKHFHAETPLHEETRLAANTSITDAAIF